MYTKITTNTYAAPFNKLNILPKNSPTISVNSFFICYLVSGTLILNMDVKEFKIFKDFFIYIAKVKNLNHKSLFTLFKKQLDNNSDWLLWDYKRSKETFEKLIKFEKYRRKGK